MLHFATIPAWKRVGFGLLLSTAMATPALAQDAAAPPVDPATQPAAAEAAAESPADDDVIVRHRHQAQRKSAGRADRDHRARHQDARRPCRSTASTIMPSWSPRCRSNRRARARSNVYFRGVASGENANHSASLPVGRHLSRRAADHHHPGRARPARVRHRAGRGTGRTARHALRRVEPGRHGPHHHQQAGSQRHVRRGQSGS